MTNSNKNNINIIIKNTNGPTRRRRQPTKSNSNGVYDNQIRSPDNLNGYSASDRFTNTNNLDDEQKRYTNQLLEKQLKEPPQFRQLEGTPQYKQLEDKFNEYRIKNDIDNNYHKMLSANMYSQLMRRSNNPYVTVPDNLDVAATAGSDDFQNGNVSQETLQHDNAEEQEFEAEQHKKDFYGVLEPPPQKAYFDELQEDELMKQAEPELKEGVPELKEAVPKFKANEKFSKPNISRNIPFNEIIKNNVSTTVQSYMNSITQDNSLSKTKIKNLIEKKETYIKQQLALGENIDEDILHSSDISDIPSKGWRG
jgi:hypothetical protein